MCIRDSVRAFRWLLATETLPLLPPESSEQNARGFWLWVLSSESLPPPEAPKSRHPGFLCNLLSWERLPEVAPSKPGLRKRPSGKGE